MSENTVLAEWSARLVAAMGSLQGYVDGDVLSNSEKNSLLALMSDGLHLNEAILVASAQPDLWGSQWQSALEDYVVRIENLCDRIEAQI